jgi:uroporphyrinogen-III synthase
VDVVPAYQTVLPSERSSEIADRLRQGEIHCVTFTSSSTVSNFFSLLDRDEILPHLGGVTIACIGPITAKTAEEYGIKVHVMPSDYTIAGLVDAMRRHFEKGIS